MLAALIVVSSATALHAADEPALVVPDSLQFAAAPALRFHVFTTTGKVVALRVVAKDFKDPAGKDRPSPLTAAEIAEVTPTGALVTLDAPDDAFPATGDYRVTLVFDAKTPEGKAVSLLKTATITRPKPEITAPGLKDCAIRIERTLPFMAASTSMPVKLMNNSAADLTSVSISGGAVNVDGDPKELIGAHVKVKPADSTSLKRGANDATIDFSDFDRAGTFQARLYVKAGPDLPADEIPFKVIVSDAPYFPLFVIFLGVVFGFVVNLIATSFKPAQESAVRVERLRAAIADAARMTSDPASVTTAQQLFDELRAIEFDNAMADAATIRTRLDAVAKRVDDFRTAVYTLANEVMQTRATLGDRIEVLRRASVDVKALEAELAAVDQRIADHAMAQAKTLEAALTTKIDAAIAAAAQPAPGAPATRGKFDFGQRGGPSGTQPVLPRMVIHPDAPRVGDEVSFSIVDASATTFRWDVGVGSPVFDGANRRATYYAEGTYRVTATPEGESDPIRGTVVVAAADFEERAKEAQKWWWTAEAVLSLVGLLVATVTGLWLLWAGKIFGTPSQYIEAFVWGFGMDSSVRGVAQVMAKLRGGS